ncbi:MAG TPA: cell division protein FtsL [Sediminispirochaeta sp.]|nr:cell division protein FtsL [Sediminispirochaeta sp.]
MSSSHKFLLLILILSVPLLLFVSVFQVYRYQELSREVTELRREQTELLERNKRMIANIAILSSPRRIAKLAEEVLEMEKSDSRQGVLRIVFEDHQEGPDG